MPGKNRDVNLNVTATEETAPAFDAVDRNIDKTQRKVDGFNTKRPTAEVTRFTSAFTKSAKDGDSAMTTLQRSIDDTEARIRKIRSDFNTRGSNGVQLFGDLDNEQKQLRTLQNAFRAVSGEVEQASVGGKDLRGVLVQMGIASAPFLAPLAAGSVLGVLAFGGVGAGILGQLKDPAVQIAAHGFGESVSESLTSATSAFGPEIVKGLGIAETGVDKFIGNLKPAFDALAPEVETIATDFTDGLAQAGPVLAKSLIAAKPDLEALSRLIGSLPDDVAKFASGLSIGAEGGAAAIDDLDTEVKQLSTDLGAALGGLSAVYGVVHNIDAVVDKFGSGPGLVQGLVGSVKGAFDSAVNPLTGLATNIDKLQQKFHSGSAAADEFDGSVNSLGVDTRNMAPVIVGVSNSVDYLGVAALTAGQPLNFVGKSVTALGEHSGAADPAVEAIGQSVASMGEHAGTSNLATQALGFTVQSLGEHSGAADPAVQAVGQSVASMGEHSGTANLATQALGFSVQSMGEHSGTAIGQLNGADTAIRGMGVDAATTQSAMNDLAASIAASSNAALAAAGDQLAVKQGYADFTKALKDNGKTFDENTQKGRDNTQGLLNALGPLQKQYQGQVDAGTATFATTQKYDAQVDKLIDLAKKNGLASGTADDLRASLEKVKGDYTATVHVKVAESANDAQLLSKATGQRIAFGTGDYLDPGFAFGPGSGSGGGGAKWTMPPAQVDVSIGRTLIQVDGQTIASAHARATTHQRHAARVGAL